MRTGIVIAFESCIQAELEEPAVYRCSLLTVDRFTQRRKMSSFLLQNATEPTQGIVCSRE